MLKKIAVFMRKGVWVIWEWLKSLFKAEYKITIYRQSEGGNMYKSEYVSRSIMVNKPKHLKFKDYETKNIVEIRSVLGLEVKIEEID